MTRDLTVMADVLGQNSAAALTFEDQGAAEKILFASQAKPHVVAACLYTADGQRFAVFVRPGSRPALPSKPGDPGYDFTDDHLELFRPISLDRKTIGTIYLQCDLGEIHERLVSFAKVASLVLAISTALAIALSFWLQRLITRPILALAKTAQAIRDNENYSLRAESQGQNEIGLLTDSFNQMLTQIQTQNDALRHAHNELEQRVRDRTAELSATNDRLRVANKELESFSYSVSHDLRTPLRGLDGFSQTLLEDYADRLDEQGKHLLQRIRAASQRMGRLIDEMLNLSRVSRSKMKREPVDLTVMAADVADELRQRDPDRHVDLHIAENLKAQGDPQLLRIALENLLGNAWKYTSKRSQATIEFGIRDDDGKSSFFVRDDGAGFDMQYVGKLFTRFQRLHGMTEFPGVGVGLATVQRIVGRHGGQIWAEAAPDKGATFYFTLS